MIYQWYTGSDSTKGVARRLNELNQRGPDASVDEAVAALRDLLLIEHDPNWRGYLLWRVGREYLKAERFKEAVATFFEAKDSFDPLLATSRDVRTEYCDTLYQLILHHYYDRDEMMTVAQLAAVITANLEEVQFNDAERAFVYYCQGFAFEILAKRHSLDWLHPVALASYLRWHRLAPEEPACLEHLAYSYFYVGDFKRSELTAKMFLEVAPEGEMRTRVETFLGSHGRELRDGKR